MTQANQSNIKIGTVLRSVRRCTEKWWPGRKLIVQEISPYYVYGVDTDSAEQLSFSRQFIADFDIVESDIMPEPQDSLVKTIAEESGMTQYVSAENKSLLRFAELLQEDLKNQQQRMLQALKDSISWHDDSGRYIPAFDSVQEAAQMYEFTLPEQENQMNELQVKIMAQLQFLDAEQYRVKQLINESGFDCTTAPFVLAKQYRDALKKQIQVLRANLED